MPVLQVHTERYETLPDGRLAHLSDWREDIAQAIAQNEGIGLTEEHWEVIRAMRAFYQEYNLSPPRKLLKKALAEQFGADKASDEHLNRLFPGNVLRQGTRIAGIPEPHLDAELERSYYTTAKTPELAKAKHFISEFEFEGESFKVYPQGNLMEPEKWTPDLARFMARKEGIELTDAHWQVINYLRKFYFDYGITPMVRLLIKHLGTALGPEKSGEDYLYQLFPGGPSRQGSRIAGLPEPQGCIDP